MEFGNVANETRGNGEHFYAVKFVVAIGSKIRTRRDPMYPGLYPFIVIMIGSMINNAPFGRETYTSGVRRLGQMRTRKILYDVISPVVIFKIGRVFLVEKNGVVRRADLQMKMGIGLVAGFTQWRNYFIGNDRSLNDHIARS